MSNTAESSEQRVAARRKQTARAAATITVIGGSLVIDGQPAGAASFTVTNTNASGLGSLAQAIVDANNAAGADIITFTGAGASGTITLDGPNFKISDDLTIVGPGRDALTLTNSAGSVLYVYNEADLTLSGLTIANVSGGTNAHAIKVDDGGDLTVTDVSIDTTEDDGIHVTHDEDEDTDVVRLTDVDVAFAASSGVDGIYISEAVEVTLSDVHVSDTGTALTGDGIDIEHVELLEISDSVVTRSGGRGIEIYPLDGPATILDTDISDSGSDGLYIDGRSPAKDTVARIERVSVANSDGHGMYLRGPSDFVLRDVEVTDSSSSGIYITDEPGDSLLERVTVERSGSAGISFEGYYQVGYLADFTLTEVTVTDSEDDGIVSVYAHNVTMTDVTTVGSGELGIEVSETIADVSLTGITASDNVEGGLYVEDTRGSVSVSSFTDTAIIDETTTVGNGDGVEDAWSFYVESVGADVTVDDVSVVGEFWIEGVDGDVEITNVTVDRNTANSVTYPQFYVYGVGGDLDIDNVEVSGANEEGALIGGVEGSTSISRMTIADSGFEALQVWNSPGLTTVVNSTIADNDVSTDNVVTVVDSDVTFVHSTIAGNTSAGSAAIGLDPTSSLVLDHSIVADNDGAVSHSGGASTTAEYSLVETGSGLAGTNIETTDPMLGALGDNGGDTRTRLPLEDSPAIDAGDSAITDQPATDQRDAERIDGPVIDIGAVETQIAPPLVSLAPQRFADTRPTGETFDNIAEKTGKLQAGGEIEVDIAGRGGVPADAVGVVMNITAIQAEAVGFVTAHACASPRPLASSLNYTPGVNLGNEVVSGLSADGSVCLYTSAAANLAVDVVGYITADSPLVNVTPARVLDTRATGETVDNVGEGAGKTDAGGTTTVKIAGRVNVPSDASAVIVNVTAVGATGTGYVTVSPCVTPVPKASSLNYVAGVNRGNEIVASLDDDGNICLFTSSSVHLTADVVGYLPAFSDYEPTTPARFLDTRAGETTVDAMNAGEGKLAAGEQVELQVAGRGDVPNEATAVVMNVTAIQGEAVGYITVHPCQETLPLASSLNYVPGVNGGNEIVAQLSADGKVCLYTSAPAHLTADVVGYIS